MRCRWRIPAAERESGMSTVEVVLLAPVVIMAILMLVGLAMMVNAKGVLSSAAADAARMGSLQRSSRLAGSEAGVIATGDLKGSVYCQDGYQGAPSITPAGFAPGGIFQVTLSCKLDYFGISMQMTSVGVSPVDLYRETN